MCQRTGLDFQDSGRLYLQVLQPVLDLGALVLVLLLALRSCALVLGPGDGSISNVVSRPNGMLLEVKSVKGCHHE